MKRKNNNQPIFYNSKDEMDKPLSDLMEELRNEVNRIRGKLFDIKMTYGWEDRIEHLEGGLTCMLVAMAYTKDEWKEFERKTTQP